MAAQEARGFEPLVFRFVADAGEASVGDRLFVALNTPPNNTGI